MTTTASETSDRFCRGCGHSLRGIASRRCPECGREFDPHDLRTTRATASRWSLEFFARAARAVIILLGVAALACFLCSALGYDPTILWVCGFLLSPLLIPCMAYAIVMASIKRAPLRRLDRVCAFVFPILIVSIIWSYWPFRLTFLMSRPRLEALAAQVRQAKGKAPAMPRQVGWFRIVDARMCEDNVGLQLTGGKGGGTHLVQGKPFGRHVWYNTNWEISLGGGWYYVYED